MGAVHFEQQNVTVAAGSSVQLSAVSEKNESLSFLSDDPQTLYVDQTGKVTAFAEGKATVRVRTASGGTASCAITVTARTQDPFDGYTLKPEDKLWYGYFYGTGILFTDKNETVFSPMIWDLDITAASAPGYAFHLRFTKLSEETGEPIYVFPSITVTPRVNEKGNIEVPLQTATYDSGFCPEAGGRYNVELIICAAQSDRVIAHGSYERVGRVPDVVQYCPYYKPTPLPGMYDTVSDQTTVNYIATAGGTIEGREEQILFKGEQSTSVTAKPNEGFEFLM